MEKQVTSKAGPISVENEEHGTVDVRVGHIEPYQDRKWWQKLTSNAIESAGIQPVPIEERTEKRVYSIFTLWFTLSLNLITYVSSQGRASKRADLLGHAVSLQACSAHLRMG